MLIRNWNRVSTGKIFLSGLRKSDPNLAYGHPKLQFNHFLLHGMLFHMIRTMLPICFAKMYYIRYFEKHYSAFRPLVRFTIDFIKSSYLTCSFGHKFVYVYPLQAPLWFSNEIHYMYSKWYNINISLFQVNDYNSKHGVIIYIAISRPYWLDIFKNFI